MTIGTGIILENTIKVNSIELGPAITVVSLQDNYANTTIAGSIDVHTIPYADEYSLSDEIIEYFTQLDEK